MNLLKDDQNDQRLLPPISVPPPHPWRFQTPLSLTQTRQMHMADILSSSGWEWRLFRFVRKKFSVVLLTLKRWNATCGVCRSLWQQWRKEDGIVGDVGQTDGYWLEVDQLIFLWRRLSHFQSVTENTIFWYTGPSVPTSPPSVSTSVFRPLTVSCLLPTPSWCCACVQFRGGSGSVS